MVNYVDNSSTVEALKKLYSQVRKLYPEQFGDVPLNKFYDDAIHDRPLSPNNKFRLKRIRDGEFEGKLTLEQRVKDGWVVDSKIVPVSGNYPII